jgi:hypothetical protein
VTIDAVGLSVLKDLGSNAQVMKTKVFDQEQIARAVELGLGASSPSEIELVAAEDDMSRNLADPIQRVLAKG